MGHHLMCLIKLPTVKKGRLVMKWLFATLKLSKGHKLATLMRYLHSI